MNLYTVKHTVIFNLLNETISLDHLKGEEAIEKALQDALSESLDGIINVDFSQAGRVNSIGINAWINVVIKVKPQLRYVRVPSWLVEQFNERRLDLLGRAVVESLFVPFFNPRTHRPEAHLLRLGTDLPALSDYEGFVCPRTNAQGDVLELDVDLNEYLHWLREDPQKYCQSAQPG